MRIACNAEQFKKACTSIRFGFAPGSNITDERELHSEKAPPETASIQKGMKIPLNRGQSINAFGSIRRRSEYD
jgi:hypothetical protein